MRIAIDFNPVLRNRYSGLCTLGIGLLEGLAEVEEAESLSLLVSPDVLAAAGPIDALAGPKVRTVCPAMRLRRMERIWGVLRWPALQRWCGPFDVYHGMHQR
jgi:hypothetical protein